MPILLSIPFQPAAKIATKIRDQGKLPPARTRHRPDQRPLHERVMFGERVDWAILSGPLALPGFTAGKAILAGPVMRLPVFAGCG